MSSHLFGSIPDTKRNFRWQINPHILIREPNPTLFNQQIVTAIQQYKGDKDGFYFGPRTRSVMPAADIDRFGEFLAFAVQQAQDLSGPDPRYRVEVRASHADLTVDRPVITWKVCHRLPGQFSTGKAGSGTVREMSYHTRSMFDDPESPSDAIIISGKRYDNWVEVAAWSQDETIANQLAIWVEDLIDEYLWYFMYQGYSRMVWLERMEDEFEEISGNILQKRPHKYFVQTEKTNARRTAILRQVVHHVLDRELLEASASSS